MIKVTYVDVEGRFESRVTHLTQRTLANIVHGILMTIVYILHILSENTNINLRC